MKMMQKNRLNRSIHPFNTECSNKFTDDNNDMKSLAIKSDFYISVVIYSTFLEIPHVSNS